MTMIPREGRDAMPAHKSTPTGPRATEALRLLTLAALVANDMNWLRTSREWGVARSTLHDWWNALDDDERADLKTSSIMDTLKGWKTVQSMAVQRLIAKLAENGDIKVHDLAVVAGIAADKVMKAEGVPDEHTITVSPGDIASEIENMLRKVSGVRSKPTQGDKADTVEGYMV
jgi:transposase-like protein